MKITKVAIFVTMPLGVVACFLLSMIIMSLVAYPQDTRQVVPVALLLFASAGLWIFAILSFSMRLSFGSTSSKVNGGQSAFGKDASEAPFPVVKGYLKANIAIFGSRRGLSFQQQDIGLPFLLCTELPAALRCGGYINSCSMACPPRLLYSSHWQGSKGRFENSPTCGSSRYTFATSACI